MTVYKIRNNTNNLWFKSRGNKAIWESQAQARRIATSLNRGTYQGHRFDQYSQGHDFEVIPFILVEK